VTIPEIETIEDGPVHRIGVTEFLEKHVAALAKRDAAIRAAQAQFNYEWDLIQLNYHGPRWLVDGKVGGWDEDPS
jgi:hypothetical protein